LLSENIASSPRDQYLHIQRGLAYSNNNQPLLALADIEAAETFGEPLDVAFAHGVLLYRVGEFSTARGYFDRYLKAHPGDLASLEYRARLLRDAGENAAALADFQQIFALNPAPDPGHYISAARIMTALPDYGIPAALELLDRHFQQAGMTTQLQRYAIQLEIDQQHYDAALVRMESLDETLRNTPHWQVEAAELHLLAGQPDQARLFLELADSKLQGLRPNGIRLELQQKVQRLLQGAALK